MTSTETEDPAPHGGVVGWLASSEARCLTAVAGADVTDVIRCFGGDPDQACSIALADADIGAFDHHQPCIFVSQAGSAVVVLEDNGYQGTCEEVLRPLSRLGRASSVYWNVNAHCSLSLAEDGFVQSSFDMFDPDARAGARLAAWDPYLTGLDFAHGLRERWAAGITAVTRATKAALDTTWRTGTHWLVPIQPVKPAMLYQRQENSPLLHEHPFNHYLADLGPDHLTSMRRYAIELAVRHTGLDRDPLAQAALEARHADQDTQDDLLLRLAEREERARSEAFALMAGEEEDGVDDDSLQPWERSWHASFVQAAMWGALHERLTTPTVYTEEESNICLTNVMIGTGPVIARYDLLTTLMRAAVQQ